MTPVIIRDEVNRALVKLLEQQSCEGRQARLGVAHRRRIIPVTRTKITLSIDQGVTQRKSLCHANQRIVGGLVAMGVILTQHITHDSGRFDGLRTRLQAHRLHRVKDAPLHGLLAIAHIGQRTPANNRHCIV